MLLLLILLPLAAALLALILPWHQGRSWLLPVSGGLHLLLAGFLVAAPEAGFGPWIGLDALSRLVLIVTSLLYFGCALYAVGYLDLRRDRGNRVIVPCLLVFLAAMTLAISARHLGLLWMAVEATTIASAPLIYYNRNRLSIEATWKYLLLCSVGIALAMLGMLFVAYAALLGGGVPVNLQFDNLLAGAATLSRPWLHAGFVFLLVGFGTKMGLAPLHSWKPDAYGEAPGMVGALLAGGLTSVAFLAILRALQLMVAAGDGVMARQTLLGMGLLSLLVAAVFMVRQPDIKRLLAYSSVEHMGILAIGVGIGGLATFGAMFHLVNNALTKGCLFLSAGNIQRAYDSKRLSEVHGAIATLPISGTLFMAGFLAITGSPPFGPFMSEFTILRGIFGSGRVGVGLTMLLLLAVVFIGMGATALTATQGEPVKLDTAFKDSLLLVLAPIVFLLLVLILGVYLPAPLENALRDAAALLEVQP
ncbi:Ech-hydrogenase-related complex, HyfF-like integral membrane subunit [Desulfuromonas sp. DDH964]|uniref:proton-conducting transporter transmembrane domain-containing protein n=1 Tax=Desulfuromonas sp. DDH964 TaxID=1823759 RepID=UPI00078B67F6|nr:proton-conducting transporter membrane subunit [Desulfuromonas sp. DDH964]AMV73062.1 Ech-hydrogenase-related complex, HyfF-like integral membrane subunit [Desulfuromonas sp. DDH964]